MHNGDDDLAAVFPLERRTVLGGILAAPLAFSLTGCVPLKSASYRVRMTVEADTPAGVTSGSSVLEATAIKNLNLLPEEHAGEGGIIGEAVVVELPNGPLFTLLKNGDAGDPLDVRITKALSPGAPFNDVDDYVAAVRKLGGWFTHAKAELPRKDWPMIVRFGDLNDPRSVEHLDPGTTGVKRILLETTRDQITKGIEKRLPWIIAAQNFRYSGTAYGDIYPVPSDAFRRGLK